MDRLRPRQRLTFSGFTKSEVEKMEKLLKDSVHPMNKEFFQKIARRFNHSSGRAGKPVVKWTEVENWFQTRQNDFPSKVDSSSDASKDRVHTSLDVGDKASDLSDLEFEARSSKDGAWYDIDKFLSHRFLPSGEAEVHVRFVGFGAEEDEWVNVKNAVRERSVPLEHSECQNVQIGDMLCCFQERRDQAIFYDAHVVDIEKRTHDIRGCRCLFTIRYEHDNTEETVRLRRLCRRPTS